MCHQLDQVVFFELTDFSNDYFPVDWFNGCKVVFPVRLESKIRLSSSVYCKSLDGSIVLKSKTLTEMIYVSLVKNRC